MIHDVAKKLNSVLTPEDLALLEKAFVRVCELRGVSPASPSAQESAKVLIHLCQSGIRSRYQLVAMLMGQKFRSEASDYCFAVYTDQINGICDLNRTIDLYIAR